MGVYIPKMTMPKNCDSCPLITDGKDYQICFVNKEFIPWRWADEHSCEQIHDRPSWCPITEVPPHGRLIDADALITVTEMVNGEYKTYIEVFEIADAPTIIESEGE